MILKLLIILLFLTFCWASARIEGPAINTATPPNLSNGDRQKHNITSAVLPNENDGSLTNVAISSSISSTIAAPTTQINKQIQANREMIRRKYNLTDAGDAGYEYEEIQIAPQLRQAFAKQIGLPSNPWGLLVNRVPCDCEHGICGCCTGMFIPAFRSVGCLNITYVPEDFSFEFKMIMNDAVLYKNRVTGRNPPPICVRPPRFSFMKMCANFYDLYFVGRNMHVCLDMTASLQEYEIFNRSFDCMRIGDKGVKIVSPEDGGGIKPGVDADIDAGYDPIADYDENVG